MSNTPPAPHEDLRKPLPGRATQDYARDSLAPFQPLNTDASGPEHSVKNLTSALPWVFLLGLTSVTTLVVVGVGFLFLG